MHLIRSISQLHEAGKRAYVLFNRKREVNVSTPTLKKTKQQGVHPQSHFYVWQIPEQRKPKGIKWLIQEEAFQNQKKFPVSHFLDLNRKGDHPGTY